MIMYISKTIKWWWRYIYYLWVLDDPPKTSETVQVIKPLGEALRVLWSTDSDTYIELYGVVGSLFSSYGIDALYEWHMENRDEHFEMSFYNVRMKAMMLLEACVKIEMSTMGRIVREAQGLPPLSMDMPVEYKTALQGGG